MIDIGDQIRVVNLAQNVPYYLWGETATVIDTTASYDEMPMQYMVCFDGSETHFVFGCDIEAIAETEESD